MANSEIGHPDYECPRCGNNAFPCGCNENSTLRKEVEAVFHRYVKKRVESRHGAKEGALTYSPVGDTLRFARWKYCDGRFVTQDLSQFDQRMAQGILARMRNSQATVA